ncbi:HPr family phosphocarrier protein [Sphingomonas sp. IBVSS1]|uniref:HPr family phosphocarrier protein n=1 Tax=Sandarakinorhabdus cyanobacteriorum TaxID=1981098 RepID=A0A255YSK7_9SPHN|nr:HPr family phosphocarrier protein [Sandarakinorhabdus cyanobacteriorum]OSZ72218.1 HPr family phosphocarrier protein [Sphingomonas sp. IBVSS1]OYQ32161.1 HPr family phosphocarrier protein [Sandarakinorhabdus cyanobacteriorum]
MSGAAGPVRVPITNRRGLHARASAKFVTLASSFDAEVVVSHDGSEVTGTSIMGLMMLAAAMGDEIDIRATGAQAEEAVAKLAGLVLDKFGED